MSKEFSSSCFTGLTLPSMPFLPSFPSQYLMIVLKIFNKALLHFSQKHMLFF